jgi:hypothetical protein
MKSKKSLIISPKDTFSDIIYQLKSYASKNKKTAVYLPDSIYLLYNPVNRQLFSNTVQQLSDKYDINLYSTDKNLIEFMKASDIKIIYTDNIATEEEEELNFTTEDLYTDFLAYKQAIQDNSNIHHSVPSEPLFEANSPNFSNQQPALSSKSNDEKPISKIIVYFSIFLGIVFASVLSLIFIPKADIKIKTNAEFLAKDFEITFDPNITDISLENKTIPSIINTISASVDGTYEATGSQVGGNKAEGKITIINKTSTSQQLVANTRFRSDKNKQFRLTESITVPANSSVEGIIRADAIGSDYNIPAGKLTIPGLEDTPTKFASIYGELKEDLKNGATEDGTVVTDQDLDKARVDLQKKLNEVVNTQVSEKDGLKSLAIQSQLNEIKYEGLPKSGDRVRSFNVKANSSLDGVFYKTEDLDKLIKSLLETQVLESQELNNVNIKFDKQQDFPNKQAVKVRVYANYNVNTKFDKQELANKIKLKTITQAKNYLQELDTIDSVEVKLTPGFSPILPVLSSRINIIIE